MAQEVATVPSDVDGNGIPPRRPGTFSSLQYRDFRFLWQGQIGAAASQWMENVARPFLILELTDSAVLVGLVAATRMVPRENVTNAIALTSAAFNTMRTLGPALAALILAFLTFGDLYVLQAVMLLWVLWSTSQIRVSTRETRIRTTSMRAELVEGFKAVKQDKPVLYILALSLVIFVWGMPFQGVFIPLIGKRELGLSTSEASLLISVVGLGALGGSLIIATIGDRIQRRGLVMLGIIATFSLSLLVFANAHSLFLVVPALALTGAMQVSFMSLNNAFVLGRTPQELHGRVLSLFHLDRGLVPAGATLGGFLAGALDPSMAQTIMAAVCLGCAAAMALAFPALRNIS